MAKDFSLGVNLPPDLKISVFFHFSGYVSRKDIAVAGASCTVLSVLNIKFGNEF